jgi:drug/metabolite transporter (DMT)-like permease
MTSSTLSRPTLIGLLAIAMWGLLALLTDLTQGVPPFLLTALTFAIASAFGVAVLAATGRLALLLQPWPALLVGIGGLFGSHAFYFSAMKNAPAAEASLIGYLWPLLIVLMSGLLPGERLKGKHVAGACLGFSGIAILALGKGGLGEAGLPLFGYLMAFLFALTWAAYSVLSRRMAAVPTEAVVAFCIGTAVLAALTHWAVEPPMWPGETRQWLAMLLLGLGPTGAAFFLWDIGMKKGDIRFLGTASYAAPVISTIALVLAGRAEAGLALGLACALIVAGAVVAAERKSA